MNTYRMCQEEEYCMTRDVYRDARRPVGRECMDRGRKKKKGLGWQS